MDLQQHLKSLFEEVQRLEENITELVNEIHAAIETNAPPQFIAELEKEEERLRERQEGLEQRCGFLERHLAGQAGVPARSAGLLAASTSYTGLVDGMPSASQFVNIWPDVQYAPAGQDSVDSNDFRPLFLMHRPHTAKGLPATLASPIFGRFLDRIAADHVQPGKLACKTVNRLIPTMCASYMSTQTKSDLEISQRIFGPAHQGVPRAGKLEFMARFRDVLGPFLSSSLDSTVNISSPTPVSDESTQGPDGSVDIKGLNNMLLAMALLMEGNIDKEEAYVQLVAYYAKLMARRWDCPTVMSSVFPAVGLEVAGDSLRVLALYYTDKVNAEPLTPYLHFYDLHKAQPAYMAYLARVLEALAAAVGELLNFYSNFQNFPGTPSNNLQPATRMDRAKFTVPYMLSERAKVEKLQGAESKHVWLCTDDNGEQTVAKICFGDYPWPLHHELAACRLTPALLPGNREPFPGGVRLVEMGYLARAKGWMPLREFDGDWDEVERLLRAALEQLQQCCGGKAVHGDLREPNLLIRVEDGHTVELNFVDLVTGGEEGAARFPLFLNHGLKWPIPEPDGKLIEQEHDRYMVEGCLERGRDRAAGRQQQKPMALAAPKVPSRAAPRSRRALRVLQSNMPFLGWSAALC